MTTTLCDSDKPYRRIEITGTKVTDCLRGAADWLDEAEPKLGEVLFVSTVRLDQDDGDGFRISVFVYEDEVVEDD